MKKLIIAFKVDQSSVYKDTLLDKNTYLYCAKTHELGALSGQVMIGAGYFVGALAYFLNVALCFLLLRKNDAIFSLIKTNRLNELIIRYIILRYAITEVDIHWVGYGFLPTNSITRLEKKCNVRFNVFNHDWYHYTGGCHVPAQCPHWKDHCAECPFKKFYAESVTLPRLNNPVFVSEFQRFKLNTIFPELTGIVRENRKTKYINIEKKISIRPSLFAREKKRVLFIGVRPGNFDNKGRNFVYSLLKSSILEGTETVGVNCDPSLPFTISFERLNNTDVLKIMSFVDCLLVPSKLETFSMVAYEALSVGTPVILRKGLPPCDWNSGLLYCSSDESDSSLRDALISFLEGC